jgi:hypothetical protein
MAGAGGRRAARRVAALLGTGVLVVMLGPAGIAQASPQRLPAPAAPPATTQCTVAQWQSPGDWDMCVSRLSDLSPSRLACLSPPTPENPDSGMPGWFAAQPASSKLNGPKGLYSRYGYAGYDYTTYDVGCISPLTHPAATFEDTIANGEFMIASSIVGASNALREKAWQPRSLWGWADTLVIRASTAIYRQVFTVFGAITLAVIGMYLVWRSRQPDMSGTLTTVGWALLVMIAVTAIARWPVQSAHVADSTLTNGLSVVHNAIDTSADTPVDNCGDPTPGACVDHRPPAVRASDTATQNLLYRDWLRGLLGSADSPTAIKYGPVLYDARSFSWDEAADIAAHPEIRDAAVAAKQMEWMKVAEQIKAEDPQAYSYLQGNQGMDRVGAGFIAILSSIFFAVFDITASVLVLMGFLIFRWVVIAAPLLGTIGLLRPASSGIRRLANAVVAAIFNIVIFGTGAAVYLYAVDLIMSTTTLPGWLQVVLMLLVGVVGWLLLRPYRRLTQLGGRDPALVETVPWHRRWLLRDARTAARREAAIDDPAPRQVTADRRRGELETPPVRPETRTEEAPDLRRGLPPGTNPDQPPGLPAGGAEPRRAPRQRPAGDWTEPALPESPSQYAIYRPGSANAPVPQAAPTHRPESTPVG